MSKKKTLLIKVSYLLDIEEEQNTEDDIENLIQNKLSEDLNLEIDNKKVSLKWEETTSATLDPDVVNCGKCSNCGRWVTDREKKEPISELCNGATLDGILLCDECLPPNHPWAF